MAAVGPFKAILSYSWDGDTGDSSNKLDVPVEAAIVRYSNENDIRLKIDVGSLASAPENNEDGGNDAKKRKMSSATPPSAAAAAAAAQTSALTPRRNPRRRCSVETAGLQSASANSTSTAAIKGSGTRTRSTVGSADGPVVVAVRLPRAAKMNNRVSTAGGRLTRSSATRKPSATTTPIAKPKGRSSINSRKKVGDPVDASTKDDVVKDSELHSNTPVWMLLLSRSGIDEAVNAFNTSTGATDQTVLAAYRILGNPPPPDELHSQSRTKNSRPSHHFFCLKSSGSDGACVSLSPFTSTSTDDLLHVAFRRDSRVATRRVGTRGQPETSICLVQSYESSIPNAVARAGRKRNGSRASHSESPPSINISSIRFQTLVESQMFQSSLISASRLDACSALGTGAPAASIVGGGSSRNRRSVRKSRNRTTGDDDHEMKRFGEEHERATSLADEMLTATVIASPSSKVRRKMGRSDEGHVAEAPSKKRGASTTKAIDPSNTASTRTCDTVVATKDDDEEKKKEETGGRKEKICIGDAVTAIVEKSTSRDGAAAKATDLGDDSAEDLPFKKSPSPLKKETLALGSGDATTAHPSTPPAMSQMTIESMVSPVRRSESKQTLNRPTTPPTPDLEGMDIDLDQLFEALDANTSANDSDHGGAKDYDASAHPSNSGTSEGGSIVQSDSTVVTTPRTTHAEDSDEISGAGMTPIPISGNARTSRNGEAYVTDDITTPTRNFLTKLFGAECGLTPFSLLKDLPMDSD